MVVGLSIQATKQLRCIRRGSTHVHGITQGNEVMREKLKGPQRSLETRSSRSINAITERVGRRSQGARARSGEALSARCHFSTMERFSTSSCVVQMEKSVWRKQMNPTPLLVGEYLQSCNDTDIRK